MDAQACQRIVDTARRAGRSTLLEPEGFELLQALGIATPPHVLITRPGDVSEALLRGFEGDRVMVKVASPDVAHKRAVGGVRLAHRSVSEVRAATEAIERRLEGIGIAGYTIHQYVPYRLGLGHELLVGLRWTSEFGPVIVCGFGGEHAEFLASRLRPGDALTVASPSFCDEKTWCRMLRRLTGGKIAFSTRELESLFTRLAEAAATLPEDFLAELEINPLVFWRGECLALDVLATLPRTSVLAKPARPLFKIDRLLHPRSIAVVGVSDRSNPGRVILRNILDQGFDRKRLYVVRPDTASVEGCRAVPDVMSLPEKVDLLIVAVGARRAFEVIEQATAADRAESLIVIAGGLGETSGSEELAERTARLLARARDQGSTRRCPVLNGGNCLGIRSVPGRYDSLFIPRYKLPALASGRANVALISQSGALLAAKMSRLEGIDFRYCISVGNQLDLTLGDYLTYLKDDPAIDLFAVYAEGFQHLDGLRFLLAAREIAARGGTVLLYRAGRTQAGLRAAASHTAAVAGSYTVTRALALEAGIVFADSLDDFEELIQLFGCLGPASRPGRRLAVVTNAGFESVAAADSLGDLKLAALTEETRSRLANLLRQQGLLEVVGARNPMDLTPIMGDGAFATAVRIVMEDRNVDAGIVGCVPLTPALNTLEASGDHAEDVFDEYAIASRLIRLRHELETPWVAVIDGGSPYEPMVRLLRQNRIPVVRTMDRAVRLMNAYCCRTARDDAKLAAAGAAVSGPVLRKTS